MQPIGTAELVKAYHERLLGHHDATIEVQVLDLNEKVLGSAQLVDGQVNIQPDSLIRRTASVQLIDPDRKLGLDGDTPWQQMPVSAKRLVRVRHTLEVPGYDAVTVTPIVGAVASGQRDGALVTVELQDKAFLASFGALPFCAPKGANAVGAIRSILAQRCGETKFRLPTGVRTRLPWSVNVGWSNEASPWIACQRIATLLGMQLFYSCDGYATLRETPTQPVITLDEDALTQLPTGASDFLPVVNYARVTVGQSFRVARLKAADDLSAEQLARNGVPGYRPAVDSLEAPQKPGKKAKRKEIYEYNQKLASVLGSAQQRANTMIHRQDESVTWASVPLFHLDADDPIRLKTDLGTTTVRLSTASIPLGTGGDMTGGRQFAMRRGPLKTGGYTVWASQNRRAS